MNFLRFLLNEYLDTGHYKSETCPYSCNQDAYNDFSGVIVDNDGPSPALYIDGWNKVSQEQVNELALDVEEADMKIIPHIILWHVTKFQQCKEVIVESNDTDVVIILLQ